MVDEKYTTKQAMNDLKRMLADMDDEARQELYDLLMTPVAPLTPAKEKPGVFIITCQHCSYTGPAPEFVKFEATYYSDDTGWDFTGYVQCPRCNKHWDFVE